jgi:hypothetical protein
MYEICESSVCNMWSSSAVYVVVVSDITGNDSIPDNVETSKIVASLPEPFLHIVLVWIITIIYNIWPCC